MSPEQIMQRAERARQLLEDPMISEALNLIEREIVDMWAACPVRDVDARESLWRLYATAQKFRGILHGTMESGRIAADNIRGKQSLTQRMLNSVR